MPPLSTHFRFATLVMPPLGIASYAGAFLAGTTAPDAFEPDNESSFAQHHFKGQDGRIDLLDFVKCTHFPSLASDDPAWSFTCGYYCHLWLDVYFRENPDRIHFKRPAGKSDAEMRSLVRKETEILNAPFVWHFGKLPLPDSKEIVLPSGLEFVNLDRCIDLFHKVVKQSQTWSVTAHEFESIDPPDHAAFLEEASDLFLDNIQKSG